MSTNTDFLSGDKMPDGSIFLGEGLFAMPMDAEKKMTSKEADEYIYKLNRKNALGHSDWRLPSPEEQKFVFANQEKGALKGTFNNASNYWNEKQVNVRYNMITYILASFKDSLKVILLPKRTGFVRCVRTNSPRFVY
ncbi:MAG: DUF1566 domain-containing protein [Alphaproteobacteria bacterium]|nr:DUF1566 domain-containing protein [Alphaproteobacteria bacterium]